MNWKSKLILGMLTALAMMFLIQDKVKTETFLASTSLFGVTTYAGILTRFEKWGGLSVVAWNPQEKSEIFLSKGVPIASRF